MTIFLFWLLLGRGDLPSAFHWQIFHARANKSANFSSFAVQQNYARNIVPPYFAHFGDLRESPLSPLKFISKRLSTALSWALSNLTQYFAKSKPVSILFTFAGLLLTPTTQLWLRAFFDQNTSSGLPRWRWLPCDMWTCMQETMILVTSIFQNEFFLRAVFKLRRLRTQDETWTVRINITRAFWTCTRLSFQGRHHTKFNIWFWRLNLKV